MGEIISLAGLKKDLMLGIRRKFFFSRFQLYNGRVQAIHNIFYMDATLPICMFKCWSNQ